MSRTYFLCGLIGLMGCAAEPAPHPTEIVFEHQWATLDEARVQPWIVGEPVRAAPATLTFPQPLSIRLTAVDAVTGHRLTSLGFSLQAWGELEIPVTRRPYCWLEFLDAGPTTCVAELSVASLESRVIGMYVYAPPETTKTCFAYALAATSTDIAALRAELDARRAACIDAFNY